MTDSEIIKALEYCVNSKDCDKCPALGKTRRCVNNLPIMFDLINRQKVEIEKLKAADVQPVKRGHWKHIAGMNSKCSECDRYFPVSEFDKRPFDINYCPNCGAKMDGEQE